MTEVNVRNILIVSEAGIGLQSHYEERWNPVLDRYLNAAAIGASRR